MLLLFDEALTLVRELRPYFNIGPSPDERCWVEFASRNLEVQRLASAAAVITGSSSSTTAGSTGGRVVSLPSASSDVAQGLSRVRTTTSAQCQAVQTKAGRIYLNSGALARGGPGAPT